MKAISVQQPWASSIALGEKTVEFRTRKTGHRGPVLICASARPVITLPDDDEDLPGVTLPAGWALCETTLTDCRPFTPDDLEAACLIEMPEKPGFAWVLSETREILPFRVKGKLNLFDVDREPEPLPEEFEHHLEIDYSSLPG